MSAVDALRAALFGDPPVPNYKPSREGVVNAFEQMMESLNTVVGGIVASDAVVKATLAELDADLVHLENTLGLVYADPDVTKNGIYIKVGGLTVGYWNYTNLLGRGPGPTQEQVDTALNAMGRGQFNTGEEIINANAAVSDMTVFVSNGQLSRLGSEQTIPFSFSTTLQLPPTLDVVDEPAVLTYVNGVAAWPFLSHKCKYANLSNITVVDVDTSDTLTEGEDYIVDKRYGAFGLASAGSNRNVLISYRASAERYDLITYATEFAGPDVVRGHESVRDAAERIPNRGVKSGELRYNVMGIPLYNARVTADSVELIKLWNIKNGIAREYQSQFLEDCRRNRDVIAPFLEMLERGENTIWSAMGDSITAIQSQMPDALLPNGPYRDRATASGTENTYLREGIISDGLIDRIPLHDYGDGAGTAHTQFGRTWDLVNHAVNRYSGSVEYRNYSIAGTNSDDSPLGMTNPARLAAWANDGSHLGIIADGMNSTGVGSALFFQRIRQMIDAAYAGGKQAVIVWGCSRPRSAAAPVADILRVNRILRAAAETPGWQGRTAAFIDLTMVSYEHGVGAMGIAQSDFCNANGYNHPGIRQHEVEGDFAQRVIFGRVHPRAKPDGTLWDESAKGSSIVLSNGNLRADSDSAEWQNVRATKKATAAKSYFEVLCDGNWATMVGVCNASQTSDGYVGINANGVSYSSGGTVFYNGGSLFTGSPITPGDYVGVAVDSATEKVWFSINGVWQNGNPAAGSGGAVVPLDDFYPALSLNQDGGTANFGSGSFHSSIPMGFVPWNG